MTASQANVDGGKKRVLVASILGQTGKDILAARENVEVIEFANTIGQDEFRALLVAQPAVHGVILGLTGFGRAELAAANGLQVVSRIGVGYDAVDVPAMSAAGIPVMICTGANCDTVAEHTLSSMFALAKRVHELDALVRMNRWHERYRYLPGEVRGREVLIVGFGRIGSRVARLCQAFGMRVRVYDPYVAEKLSDGHLAGAAIDVFLPEPPVPGNPLLEMSNVICSPHLAGVTREAVERMAQLAAANALSVFDGEPHLDNAVNRNALTTLATA
jgi:D-3-phosphoglycerate dehydrogenase